MRNTWETLYLATILTTILISTAHCYIITVDAHAEECFFEKIEANTKMGKFLVFISNYYQHYILTHWLSKFIYWLFNLNSDKAPAKLL